MNKDPKLKVKERGGIAVMVVLVCLTVAMFVGVAVVKYAILDRQLLRDKHRRVQAQALAESGIARAAAQLERNRDYRGETWRIEAAELADRSPAIVTIRVTAADRKPQERSIQAVAEYPADALEKSRHTLTIPFTLPAAGDTP